MATAEKEEEEEEFGHQDVLISCSEEWQAKKPGARAKRGLKFALQIAFSSLSEDI